MHLNRITDDEREEKQQKKHLQPPSLTNSLPTYWPFVVYDGITLISPTRSIEQIRRINITDNGRWFNEVANLIDSVDRLYWFGNFGKVISLEICASHGRRKWIQVCQIPSNTKRNALDMNEIVSSLHVSSITSVRK